MPKPKMLEVTTPKCMVCGKTSTILVEESKLRRWQRGEHIQQVWPDKTNSERELLKSGTHDKCWDEMFKNYKE